ncbi:MAG: cytochrome c biogenesis protein CcsA [Gaiellaceae bacterium]
MSLRNNRTVALASAAAALLLGGVALAFYWVPNAPEEGFRQRIFYIHVPVALTAYACFAWAAWKALRLLWTRDQRYDLESYTAVHMGVIFGVLTLVTGSIWARTSWGPWWSWSERQLVLFLVLFLFYSAYFMLRFSTDPGRGAPTCRRSTRSSASSSSRSASSPSGWPKASSTRSSSTAT